MIVSMLIFFGLSVRVAVSIGLASLAGVGTAGLPGVVVAQQLFAALDKYPLVAIPFFILAGNLMNIAGITGRIYNFAVALVGWMRGGLGQTMATRPNAPWASPPRRRPWAPSFRRRCRS
ncbi:hypothetical protein G6F66_014820 [Rhizopus arrhizus]|nr:hypothetical protein G6F66_014820 [Rhizopus arrhizus]